MSWYMFWKECERSRERDKEYFWFEDKNYPNGDGIKEECELWAERMPGGHNTSYQYGYKKVNKLPKDVEEEKIQSIKHNIKSLKKELKFLEEQ